MNLDSQDIYEVAACIVLYGGEPDLIAKDALSFLQSGPGLHLTLLHNHSPEPVLEKVRILLQAETGELLPEITARNNSFPGDSKMGHPSSGETPESTLKSCHGNRIRFIRSRENRGFGAGHNLALKIRPASKYYLVLNPDVILHPGTLKTMVNYLENHTDVGLLSPKILNPDGTLQPLNKRLPSLFDLFARRFLPRKLQEIPRIQQKMNHYIMLDQGYERTLDVPFLSGAFLLFRSSILEKVGLFDERFFMYFEDTDMNRRVQEFARGVYLPDAVITHHWSRVSHKRIKYTWIFIVSAFRYFQKWGWKLF